MIGGTAGKGDRQRSTTRRSRSTTCACGARSHMAIDRKALIDGVAGRATAKPIGSHMAPSDAGYVDLTGVNPYDPEKAKALLKEAGVATPLNVTLTLPPTAVRAQGRRDRRCAAREDRRQREDRERRVGAVAVGRVQGQLRPDDHQPRRAARLRHRLCGPEVLLRLRQQAVSRPGREAQPRRPTPKERTKLFGDIQRHARRPTRSTSSCSNCAQFAVAKKGLKGLWSSSPMAANDMAAVTWSTGPQ